MGFITPNVDIREPFQLRTIIKPEHKNIFKDFVNTCFDCNPDYQGFVSFCVKVKPDKNLSNRYKPLVPDPRDTRPYDSRRNLSVELKDNTDRKKEIMDWLWYYSHQKKTPEKIAKAQKLKEELNSLLFPRPVDATRMVTALVTRPEELEKRMDEFKLYEVDTYLTANRFKSTKSRSKKNLFGFSNIVIDIDLHDRSYKMNEKIKLINRLVYYMETDLFYELCDPNAVVFTGRGVQLWFTLDPIHAKCKTMYRATAEFLAKTINKFLEERPGLGMFRVDAAASSNSSGLLRMPCSYNTSAGTWGDAYIRHADRISLPEMYEQLVKTGLVTVKCKKQKKYIQPKDKLHLAEIREAKLAAIVDVRIAEGTDIPRDLFLLVVFCAYMSATGNKVLAYKHMLDFNKLFPNPMPEKEARAYMSTAERKAYHYKNETIIDLLGITEEEQDLVNLYAVSSKYREKTGCAGQRPSYDEAILEGCREGLNKRQIAQKAGCSPQTVGRILKKYKMKTEKEKLHNSILQSFLHGGKAAKHRKKMSRSNIYYIARKAARLKAAARIRKKLQEEKKQQKEFIKAEKTAMPQKNVPVKKEDLPLKMYNEDHFREIATPKWHPRTA